MQNSPIRTLVFMFLTLTMALGWASCQACADETALPRPSLDGSVSVEKALATRTTARSYSLGSAHACSSCAGALGG